MHVGDFSNYNRFIVFNSHPFPSNASFLYHLKTSESLTVFWCFQGVEKGCLGANELINNINNYGNVRKIMDQCLQVRCSMWPQPLTTFSNRIRHCSIELLMIFLSVSHASDIGAESPSMSSYPFAFLWNIFFTMFQIA